MNKRVKKNTRPHVYHIENMMHSDRKNRLKKLQ